MNAARYRLRARLETGELAELFKAKRDDGFNVVIKLFHPNTTDLRYARALAEVSRALTELEQPGLLHVVDIGLIQGRLAVVREDMAGSSLGEVLQRLNTREVTLAPSLALSLAVELLQTVGMVHEAGVVHGSITPGNVALARTGHVVIHDFGALDALLAVPALKKSFAPKGRAIYRAPELGVGEAASVHSDVYSIGSLLYELLTLKGASVGKDAGVRTRSEKVLPPSHVDRRLNSRLDAVVMRAIESTPQRRYRTCGEFQSAIRGFLASSGGMPSRSDAAAFLTELFPKDPSGSLGGPLPLQEEFSLTEVSGVDLPPVERSLVVESRRPYTTVETDMTAARAAEAPDAETQDSYPPELSYDGGGAAPAWDAPAAAAPSPRRAKVTSAPVKVKLVEDFSGSAAAGPDVRAMRNAPPTRSSLEVPPSAAPAAAPQTATDHPLAQPQADTHERPPQGRRRKVLFAGLVAVFAGLVALIVVLQLTLRSAPAKPPAPVSAPLMVTAREVKTEPADHEAPGFVPSGDSGYLTILSDEPALISIDGVRLSRRTPLTRYPVSPGTRKILLESVATKERREFSLMVERGQLRTVEERFGAAHPETRKVERR